MLHIRGKRCARYEYCILLGLLYRDSLQEPRCSLLKTKDKFNLFSDSEELMLWKRKKLSFKCYKMLEMVQTYDRLSHC